MVLGTSVPGDYTIVFAELHLLPAYGNTRVPLLVLARGPHVLLTTGQSAELVIEREHQEQGAVVPDIAKFVWREGSDQISLTLSHTQLIANAQQGPMWMLRFLAAATLCIQIGELQEEVHGHALYEHPTFRTA